MPRVYSKNQFQPRLIQKYIPNINFRNKISPSELKIISVHPEQPTYDQLNLLNDDKQLHGIILGLITMKGCGRNVRIVTVICLSS